MKLVSAVKMAMPLVSAALWRIEVKLSRKAHALEGSLCTEGQVEGSMDVVQHCHWHATNDSVLLEMK